MAKTIQEEFLYKKAYEFSYATSRIAASAKNPGIAELLENKAVNLLDSVLVADYAKTKDLVNAIISISSLLSDSGLLNPVNRDVLFRESESISLAIEALPKNKEMQVLPDLGLNRVFSKAMPPFKRNVADKQAKPAQQSEIITTSIQIADKPVADEIADKVIADESVSAEERTSFKSEARQSAIIAKLSKDENLPNRQAGCRLNELQEMFPNVSERTLRYDLESLISDGFIERIGSRRNSVYRLKGKNSAVIELPSHSVNGQGF